MVEKQNKNGLERLSSLDVNDGDVINVVGLAQTTAKFVDNNPNSETFENVIERDVIVQKVKYKGAFYSYRANEGTALYNQLRDYISKNNIELPAKILDLTFTVVVGKGKGKGKYVLYKELIQNDESLFE